MATELPWLLTFAALGWGLGWMAVRDRRWSLLPAATTVTVLAAQVMNRLFGNLPGYQGAPAVLVGLLLGLTLCLIVPHLPDVRARAWVSAVLVPFAAYHLLLLAVFLFFVIFQIP